MYMFGGSVDQTSPKVTNQLFCLEVGPPIPLPIRPKSINMSDFTLDWSSPAASQDLDGELFVRGFDGEEWTSLYRGSNTCMMFKVDQEGIQRYAFKSGQSYEFRLLSRNFAGDSEAWYPSVLSLSLPDGMIWTGVNEILMI